MTLYVPNPDFDAEWLASSEAVELVAGLAGDVADAAVANVPKRLEELADSIEAEAGVVDGVATGRVNAHDFKAHWHEWGTRRMAATPYLEPAAAQIVGPVSGGDR